MAYHAKCVKIHKDMIKQCLSYVIVKMMKYISTFVELM